MKDRISSKTGYTLIFTSAALLLALALGVLALTCSAMGGSGADDGLPDGAVTPAPPAESTPAESGSAASDTSAPAGTDAPQNTGSDVLPPQNTGAGTGVGTPSGSGTKQPGTDTAAAPETGNSVVGAIIAVIVVVAIILVIIALMPRKTGKAD